MEASSPLRFRTLARRKHTTDFRASLSRVLRRACGLGGGFSGRGTRGRGCGLCGVAGCECRGLGRAWKRALPFVFERRRAESTHHRRCKLSARRARHRPVRCFEWVSGWLGSPWGGHWVGPLAISRLTSPLRRRGALREPWILPPSTPNGTMQACGAASSPVARALLRVGQWVARKSVGEGIGWAHWPFQDSRALRRRGALREPWILPL